MDFTPRLSLPYIASQQAQKQVTYNAAMQALDALVQPAVLSRTIAAPPGSPAEGDAYLVPAGATGAWAGKDEKLAVFIDGAWSFRTAAPGWLAYVADGAEIAMFHAGAWTALVSNGGTTIAKFGINATADLTNRLVVESDASLFSHAGASHRLKLNKAASGDTASALFQTGFVGHAEFGLAGDDDFAIKVSDDGSTWHKALSVARASGLVSLPLGQLGFPAAQNPSAGANVLDDYEEGTYLPTLTFGGGSTGLAYGSRSAGYVKIGALCWVYGRFLLSAKGSSTGQAEISLPFTAGNGLSDRVGIASTYGSGLTGIVGTIVATTAPPSAAMALWMGSATGNNVAVTDAHFTNTAALHFTGCFSVV